MQYLTPSEMSRDAPASMRLPSKKIGLIDTSGFVRFIERKTGYRPVMAIQGSPHKDTRSLTQRERLGRHMIVCASGNGSAIVLLNSHTVRRKAWIAGGFVRMGGKQPLVLIGVALPLQRWRGFGPAIEELERYRPLLNSTRKAMVTRTMSTSDRSDLALKVSKTAYLPGHKPVSSSELEHNPKSDNLYATMFDMLSRMHNGMLQAADGGRKVKPLKGPDALMQAGNAMFNAGVSLIDETVVMPRYRKT
jgi:hypothetical protein